MTEFFETRMGRTLYEHTVPELARQLSRLNDNLERLIEAAHPPIEPTDDDDEREETQPAHA